MSNPYFEIGEEIILQTNLYPELNGEHTITDYSFELFDDESGGTGLRHGYELSCGDWFDQSCLRKKHKGSEDNESFSQLITNLNKQTEPV